MRRFTRNSLARMAAQGTGKLALFLWTLILARTLEPEGLGTYAYLYSLVGILLILSDYGLGYLATRRVAAHPEDQGVYLTRTLLLRLILAAVSYALLLALVFGTSEFSDTAAAALLLGGLIFTTSLLNGFNAILNAREELHWSSLLSALLPLLTLGAGVILLRRNPTLAAAAAPSLIAGVLVLLAARLLFAAKGIGFDPAGGLRPLIRLLRTGFPYFTMTILAALNVNLDTLLLKWMRGETEVGLYNASYRLVLAVMVVPLALSEAALPVWSRAEGESGKPSLPVRSVIRLLLMAGLPLSLALFAGAPWIMETLFGTEYAGSAPILRVHAWTLVLMFLNSPLGHRLISQDRLGRVNLIFALVTALNCVLNLIVIPRYGAVGAALATLASEGLNLILLSLAVRSGPVAAQPLREETASR